MTVVAEQGEFTLNSLEPLGVQIVLLRPLSPHGLWPSLKVFCVLGESWQAAPCLLQPAICRVFASHI